MFNFSDMLNNPRAQEAMLKLMSQQMANFSPEQKEAIARVSAKVIKRPRGLEIALGEGDDPTVDKWITGFINGWSDLLPKILQSAGFTVDLYE
jgi:hypothetical protein